MISGSFPLICSLQNLIYACSFAHALSRKALSCTTFAQLLMYLSLTSFLSDWKKNAMYLIGGNCAFLLQKE